MWYAQQDYDRPEGHKDETTGPDHAGRLWGRFRRLHVVQSGLGGVQRGVRCLRYATLHFHTPFIVDHVGRVSIGGGRERVHT